MTLRKPSRSQLVKQADGLFSRYIKQRDGHCRACGQDFDLQCAHVFSRSYHAIRWDEDNALALDRGCHVRFTHRPIEWERFVRDLIGNELYHELQERALHYERVDLPAVIDRLREMVSA